MNNNHFDPNKPRLIWLHLSDAHLPPGSADTYRVNKVLGALITTLREDAAKGWQPDVIFFTGDLADKGKDYKNAKSFFDDLLDATGLKERFHDEAKRRLFVVPGNHDVDRVKTKFLERPLNTSEDSDEFFSPEHVEFRQPYFGRFHTYQEFFNDYFAGIRQFSAKQHWYAEVLPLDLNGHILRLRVIGLNSAWFCQDEYDKGKLWIGERTCDDAFNAIEAQDGCDLTIVLHHHPYICLHSEEIEDVSGLITNKADISLYGHIHEPDTQATKDQHGEILRFQAGAAYDKANHKYRAFWGTVDLTAGKVRIKPIIYHKGHPPRWDHDTSVYPPPNIGEFNLSRPITLKSFQSSYSASSKQFGDVSLPEFPEDTTRSIVLPHDKFPEGFEWHKQQPAKHPVEFMVTSLGKTPSVDISKLLSQPIQSAEILRGIIPRRPLLTLSSGMYVIPGVSKDGLSVVEIIQLIGCGILPFEKLKPSEGFGGEKLSAHPIRSLNEVNEFFIETEKVKEHIKDGTISFDHDLVFMDVHGSGKTSLLAYLSKLARDLGYNPFWAELPEDARDVDLQRSVEQAFIHYGPQKPILVIDAAEKCPSVINSILTLKRGMYCDLPIWLSIASEEVEPLQEGLSVLERDFGFLRLPLPGTLSDKDIKLFIERIRLETTPEVCEYLRTWAKDANANPGLMLEAYRVIIEGKRKGVGEQGLQRQISSIADDSSERYEDLFNRGLDQHMREVITYVAALGEVDIDLLKGMIAKRGLDEDRDLVDVLDVEKRRLFVKEKHSEFEDKSLRLVYLHDGLRRVALRRGNFDVHIAKEIAKILVDLSTDPILGGKACLAFLKLYINFKDRFRLLTRDIRGKLSSTLLSSQPDPRKYFVAAVLVNEFPELITLWRSALANCGDAKVWSNILDIFGVHVGNIMRMHKEARDLFEKSLSINHGHLQSLIHLAQAYIFLGDRDSVLTAFGSAPNELKETNEYLKAHADILFVLNREDEACELWEGLLEEDPNNVGLLTNLSVYYTQKDDPEKAKELLLRAVKSEPRNQEPIDRLVKFELRRQGHEPLPADEQKRAQAILSAIDKLLEEIQDNHVLLKERGSQLAILDREEEARELWESLLEEDPNNVGLLTNLSVYYTQKDDPEKAKELLLRAVKSEPRNQEPIDRLVKFELRRQGHEPLPADEQKRAQAILSAIDKLLEEIQDNHVLLKERGSQLAILDREEEARELWESLLEEDPNNVWLLTNLSVYYTQKYDPEKAKELLLRAVKSEPRNQGTIARLVNLELRRQGHEPLPADEQKRAQAILSAIDKLLEELQDNHVLLKERGSQLAILDREEEARELWESLLEEEPNNVELLTNLSVYYTRKDDPEKAKGLLLRAVKSEPRNQGTIARLVNLELRRQGHESLPEDEQKRAQAILSAIDKLLEELQDNPVLLKERGSQLAILDREEEARELWESLLEEDPNNVGLLTNLSVYYTQKDDPEKAKELLLRAVKSEPRNQGTIARLVNLELRRQGHEPLPADEQERAQATLSAIDKLFEGLPGNPVLRKWRGDLLAILDREEEARELWESLLEEDPNNVGVLRCLTINLLNNRQFSDAVPFTERCLKLQPSNEDTIGLALIAYTNTFTGEILSSKISPLLERIYRDSDKPRDIYNLACGYAQLGYKEDMLWALRVTKSFDERILSIARADPDFDDFKDDPDFLEVVT